MPQSKQEKNKRFANFISNKKNSQENVSLIKWLQEKKERFADFISNKNKIVKANVL